MGRVQIRKLRRKLKKEVVEFLKIQNHYFPRLLEDITEVMDGRHQSYIEYEIEVIGSASNVLKSNFGTK